MPSAQLRQWTAATVASIGLMVTATFLGWPSPVLPRLQKTMSASQLSWVVSLPYLGSVVSPLPAGGLMDRWGRRAVLRTTGVLPLVSWALVAATDCVYALYLARFLGGMWGGISYCVTPVYLSEIAEPRVRGALNTVFTLMVYLGLLFEYLAGPLMSYTALALVSGLVPLAYLLALGAVPESPYYFLMKGKRREAREALSWLRCTTDVEDELTSLESALEADAANKGGMADLLLVPGLRRALCMAETAAFLQRMSGSSVLMAYVSSVVPAGSPVTGNQCAVVMCALWLVIGVGSTLTIDRLGRRPLLAVSCAGCALATGLLAGWFWLESSPGRDLRPYALAPFLCLLVYSLFYPLGLACVPSVVQGELFPSHAKASASGVTAVVVAVVSFVTNRLYRPLADAYGPQADYLCFTAGSAYGVYFALYVLMETRGKTLRQIHDELNERRGDSKDATGDSAPEAK